MIQHTPIVKTRPTPAPNPYDPNRDARICSTCGQRSGWRRSLTLGGAWVHCNATEPRTQHGVLTHTCSALCAWEVAA